MTKDIKLMYQLLNYLINYALNKLVLVFDITVPPIENTASCHVIQVPFAQSKLQSSSQCTSRSSQDTRQSTSQSQQITGKITSLSSQSTPHRATEVDHSQVFTEFGYVQEVCQEYGKHLDTEIFPTFNPDQSNDEIFSLVDSNISSSILDKNSESNILKFRCGKDDGNRIHVRLSKKYSTGKRIWDKVHSCWYCYRLVPKLVRHLEICHSKEADVAALLSHTKKDAARVLLCERLTRMGDYYHNLQVLNTNQGELIILRSPSELDGVCFDVKDYVPCPACLGFVTMTDLWRHCMRCHHIKSDIDHIGDEEAKGRRNIKRDSGLLLFESKSALISPKFSAEVLRRMKNDLITSAIMSDWLILDLGMFMFEKHGASRRRMISEYMRIMGRLLLFIREYQNNHTVLLQDYIKLEKFDDLVTCVKNMCSPTNSMNCGMEFSSPSLAVKIGLHVSKCASLLRGKALRSHDLQWQNEIRSFQKLYKFEWSTKISSHAYQTLALRKGNKLELLQCVEDVVKLAKYQEQEIARLNENLSQNHLSSTWLQLAEHTLTRIVVFNKCRIGEASKMLIGDFSSRCSWYDSGMDDFRASLSPFEKNLSEMMDLVKIQGKCGNNVSILLTGEMVKAIDILNATRSDVGISSDNPYIFARVISSKSNDHLSGSDCLQKLSSLADLKASHLIRSTQLRKYIATTCQIFNLSDSEIDWLAEYLGHDIRTQRYYRLRDSSIELAKISKLLLVMEKGNAEEWRAKSLDDITLDMEGVCAVIEDESEEELSSGI